MLKRLNSYLIAGILMVAPLTITVVIGYQIVIYLDKQVDRFLPDPWRDVPGLGFVILVLSLMVIGIITTGVLGRILHALIDFVLDLLPVPIIRSIYRSLRQMLEQVLSHSSTAFREVVLVEYPRKGVFAIGFISGEAYQSCQVVEGKTLMNVFVPTTPNPTSGFLLLVPKDMLYHTDLSIEDGIKLVVSSGIVQPEPPLTDPAEEEETSPDASSQARASASGASASGGPASAVPATDA